MYKGSSRPSTPLRSRKIIRLPNYDYSNSGDYFVTICVKDFKCVFGKIQNRILFLNQLGNIAKKCWLEIPEHFPCVGLDEFIIMPNHLHGIIMIRDRGDMVCRDTACRVPTGEQFSKPTPGSIPTIIRSYKSAVKKWANENGFDGFRWQGRFYEHIIRNEKSLNNIRDYIINNPVMWDEDRNNPKFN